MRLATVLVFILLSFGFGSASSASERKPWQLRVGAHMVSPKSNNHSVVEVEEAASLTFNITYFMTQHWAVELLAAAPFEHDIELVGGGTVARTKHLPPTLSAQYHFLSDGKFRPYAGIGLNWTLFFSEDTTGALAGSRLSLDDSVGLAGQVGIDIQVAEQWFVNAEARYLDIDTDAKLDGASLGSVEIDPWAFGINVGYRF